ncbi:uncharacterized protein (DUF302 family) [Pullulanibacillus pueri]|uniref:Glyoxalase-like domain-containing protein n=1 Tax=Pullulanibacillus pueri TaxID=1437324 RepID=A0A8J3EJF1_9BACL|nr:VOC family protein [Pullulanibacillus pueri]MBM7679869.1 uncharacterized protein (DUF302 family) [Pullulanibacillus pueri]GGH73247.1 hypothetical protein GCM10007096_00280 [Pullulanibacillus pueri]
MTLSLDHLVWFAHKPEAAIDELKGMGIHAIQGGRHEKWGTYNSLAYFGLSYIEFIGIKNVSIAKKEKHNRLIIHIVEAMSEGNGEGPARIAIRTNHIEELAEKFKKQGLAVFGPFPGERMTQEGEVLKWSLLFPEDPASTLQLPFFIQWEETDDVRYASFKDKGLVGKHIADNLKIESVGIAVRNLDETVNKWARLIDGTPGETYQSKILSASYRELELSESKLIFCTPNGRGIAQDVLTERGETPFLVNFKGAEERKMINKLNGYWGKNIF